MAGLQVTIEGSTKLGIFYSLEVVLPHYLNYYHGIPKFLYMELLLLLLMMMMMLMMKPNVSCSGAQDIQAPDEACTAQHKPASSKD